MSGESAQWFFNASASPFSPAQPADWKPYSSEDNGKIEQSFQKKEPKAYLANHYVHFHEKMQVHKEDFHRQRPVKRVAN